MNIKEFGSWSPYNRDNLKYTGDEYNRSFIKERFECPEEFEGSDYDEYYSVPKMTDSFDFQKKQNEKSKQKPKNTKNLRQSMLSRVACLAAGSVIITTSYQAAVKQQAQITTDIPAYEQTQTEQSELTPDWKWADDNSSVTIELSDKNGKVVATIPAKITTEEKAPTCNKEGEKTYTAKAEYKKKSYKDTRTESLKPLGHDFDDGTEKVQENGETTKTFVCNRCHEEFTFKTTMTEND